MVTNVIAYFLGVGTTVLALFVAVTVYLAAHPITFGMVQKMIATINFESNILGALRKRNWLERIWDKIQLGWLIIQIILAGG